MSERIKMKQNKRTVKQSLQGKDWQFCFDGLTLISPVIRGVCLSQSFLSVVLVLVDILRNINNFLQNEHFIYIFDSEKTMPTFGKNKVCMEINAF